MNKQYLSKYNKRIKHNIRLPSGDPTNYFTQHIVPQLGKLQCPQDFQNGTAVTAVQIVLSNMIKMDTPSGKNGIMDGFKNPC